MAEITAEQQQQQNEARAKAVVRYRILQLLQFLLGGGLLACGALGSKYSDDSYGFGLPYYLGGFLVGAAMLTGAALSGTVARKGREIHGSGEKKREVVCAITGQSIIAMLTFMFCILGLCFAGVSGCDSYFDDEDYCSTENGIIRYAIIGGCAMAILTNIYSLYLGCVFGPYFGVVMRHRRRMALMTVDQEYPPNTMANPMMPGDTFGFHGDARNDERTQQLQRENELLQQQLSLQQQLNQQQQQQYGGQYAPPAPVSYGFSTNQSLPQSTSFPTPAVPPPAYDALKQ